MGDEKFCSKVRAHRRGRKSPQSMPRRRRDRNSYYAGVSSDRTNLSPFTKDYRGLALSCDFTVFVARPGTHYTHQNKIDARLQHLQNFKKIFAAFLNKKIFTKKVCGYHTFFFFFSF